MRKYIFCFFLLPCLIVKAQLNQRQASKDFSKKLAVKYTNDNGSSASSNSFLFAETNPIGYDLFAANLAFSDKNQVQKVGFSPFRLSNKYVPIISNFRINISNSTTGLTTGFSIGNDNSAFETKRVQRIFNTKYTSTQDILFPVARARGQNETLAEYMNYYITTPEMKTFQDALLESFDELRLKHVIKWSLGYNAQFFPVLKSESAAGNFDSLNYHGFKGNNLFGKVDYSYKNGKVNINLMYNYFNKRKSADSIQQLRKYDGFSLGASVRLFKLIKEEELKKKDFYKTSLFIPSLNLGINYEQLTYKGLEDIYAEDKVKSKKVLTFFVDVAISPPSQFRLSFPIQTSKEFSGKNPVQVISLLQYTYKLINLGN